MPTEVKKRVSTTRVKDPIIDHLTIIVPWGIGPQYLRDAEDDLFEEVAVRIGVLKDEGFCQVWRAAQSRYRLETKLQLPGGAKALIEFGAKKPMDQKGGIRIELNPRRMAPVDAEYLHNFIRRAVGPSYDRHLLDAIVNRMDMAVDVENVRLGDLLIDYKGAHEVTFFGTRLKKNRVETMNFGSVTSDYRTTVYDKRKERVDNAIKRLTKHRATTDDLKQNLIRQVKAARNLPPMIRIEVRGMKIGRPVYELRRIDKKRFQRFLISELNGLDTLTDSARVEFLALVHHLGLRAAITHYRGTKTHKLVKKITDRPAPWWEPDGLWERGVKVLKTSGILPKAAFKSPEKR